MAANLKGFPTTSCALLLGSVAAMGKHGGKFPYPFLEAPRACGERDAGPSTERALQVEE